MAKVAGSGGSSNAKMGKKQRTKGASRQQQVVNSDSSAQSTPRSSDAAQMVPEEQLTVVQIEDSNGSVQATALAQPAPQQQQQYTIVQAVCMGGVRRVAECLEMRVQSCASTCMCLPHH